MPEEHLRVLVLAEEAAVAGDLCGLLGEAFPHWSLAGGTFAEAAERVGAGETAVALVDLRADAADPEVVSRLTGAFPALPVVVIARDPEQGEAARRLGAQEYWEGEPGSGRGWFLRRFLGLFEIQLGNRIARPRPQRMRCRRGLIIVQPAVEKPFEPVEMSFSSRRSFRSRPTPAPALFDRQPCREEGVSFRRAHGTRVADEQLFAIETQTGNTELHGVRRGRALRVHYRSGRRA